MKQNTKAIHFSYQKPDAYGALTMPVYHTAAYEFADADVMADAFCGKVELPDYSRITNPTVIYLEKKVQALTGASSVWAFTSGMAAGSVIRRSVFFFYYDTFTCSVFQNNIAAVISEKNFNALFLEKLLDS